MPRLLLLLSCLLAMACAFVPAPSALSVSRVAAQRQAISMGGAMTKATRVNVRNREYNKKYKSEMKTKIKRVFEAVAAEDYSVAFQTLSKAQAIIDKNVKRGIMPKNRAARRKSLLTLKVKALEPAASAAAPAPAPEAAPEP
uniref:Ribosomal protein S20 n=1 Tax=Haptolina ericina TaxID=156174 RepID=A0A7S3AKB5_9EUKA|mmetsp:Transcript_21789/g.49116  ORF Transcript_21789/g.49116 Transcript_21789/m.49116 type:complete len:142 (+) Transcript_21789:41-466(+)